MCFADCAIFHVKNTVFNHVWLLYTSVSANKIEASMFIFTLGMDLAVVQALVQLLVVHSRMVGAGLAVVQAVVVHMAIQAVVLVVILEVIKIKAKAHTEEDLVVCTLTMEELILLLTLALVELIMMEGEHTTI